MFGWRQAILLQASRKWYSLRLPSRLKRRFSFEDLKAQGLTRNEQYFYCVYFFDHFLPGALTEHRRYFTQSARGFGEDAFHTMWFLLFERFRPQTALEIGVYRGQTIVLWKLLSRHFGSDCSIGCISPFTPAGDSVSRYGSELDYFHDVKEHHRHFNLPLPEFCREFSTSPVARCFIEQRRWQFIYIDGNHDYEIASQDWALCSKAIAPGGIIVLDDSALGTDFTPPRFATAGHPGPSRLTREIDPSQFREIFSVGHNRVFQRIS